jgi:alpha-amylase/alpha-mannosidase (GH57 family)
LTEKHVCIHGHFYQPPRENPWVEEIEFQETAHPYHDWNTRIAAECYEPNSASRIMGPQGRIIGIVNNYSKINFNFGPTLLSWIEKNKPALYKDILQADKQSIENFSGHGSAIAQVYNHMIMPLANKRDKETQVKWAIRDFETRFGRFPEGMWLPETAVDIETLETLAENGIKFTSLSSHQARRTRKIGEEEWKDLSEEKNKS